MVRAAATGVPPSSPALPLPVRVVRAQATATLLPPHAPAADHGGTPEHAPDAIVATRTIATPYPHTAPPRVQAARTSDGSPHNSAGPEPALCLEPPQAA
jgi:hypothetical protein